MNLYAYCGDNPTDATDPSGMVGVFFDGAGQVRGDETIMQDLYEEYDGSAAIFYTHILPNNIWANIHGAQDIVAEEVGKKGLRAGGLVRLVPRCRCCVNIS